jgi:general secretion pathway protein C
VVNKKIVGFRVRKIKKNSMFSKLGLRKEDIITHVNDKPLKSYGDAFKIYYNIDNVKRLKLSIKRGNETKEIDYEVY